MGTSVFLLCCPHLAEPPPVPCSQHPRRATPVLHSRNWATRACPRVFPGPAPHLSPHAHPGAQSSLPAVSDHSGCSPGKRQPPGGCGPCSSPLCPPRRQPLGVFPLQPLGGSGAEGVSRLPLECILCLTHLWLWMQLTAPQPQFPHLPHKASTKRIPRGCKGAGWGSPPLGCCSDVMTIILAMNQARIFL